MKKLYIILGFIILLILSSCSYLSSNDTHDMKDGSEMQWAIHEEPQEPQKVSTQINKETPSQEIDEESIVWDGNMHSMDDGTNMEWATHDESEDHVEWDTHDMEDGSKMQWTSHVE